MKTGKILSAVWVIFIFLSVVEIYAEEQAPDYSWDNRAVPRTLPPEDRTNIFLIDQINGRLNAAEKNQNAVIAIEERCFLNDLLQRMSTIKDNDKNIIERNENGDIRRVIFEDKSALDIYCQKNDSGQITEIHLEYTKGSDVLKIDITSENITITLLNQNTGPGPYPDGGHEIEIGDLNTGGISDNKNPDGADKPTGPVKQVKYDDRAITIKYRIPALDVKTISAEKIDGKFFAALSAGIKNTHDKLRSDYGNYKKTTSYYYKSASMMLKHNYAKLGSNLSPAGKAALKKLTDGKWNDTIENREAMDGIINTIRSKASENESEYEDIAALIASIDRLRNNVVDRAEELYKISQEEALNKNAADINGLLKEYNVIMAVQKGRGEANDSIKAVVDLAAGAK